MKSYAEQLLAAYACTTADAYRNALKEGLHTFDMLQERYGIGTSVSVETIDGLMMQIPGTDQDSAHGR